MSRGGASIFQQAGRLLRQRPKPHAPPERLMPDTTPVHKRLSFDISITGFVYSAMMMFLGIAGVSTQVSLLFGVFGLMIGILMVSGFVSKKVLGGLELRRLLPDQAIVGRPMLIHYAVRNAKKRWATLSVTVGELDGVQGFRRQPHAYLLHVASGMTASVNCEIVPKRRGIQLLNRYQLSTSFPFGFVKRAIIRNQPDTLLVFPPLAEVDRALLRQFRSAETSGHNLKPKLGGMDEFYGLKEYRQGESPRFIHWKRSARTGTLVSLELTQVSPPRVLVVVDTFNPQRSLVRASEVEKSIAQAASLISAALDSGLAIGLVARGADWITISASRGKRHRRELLSQLATLPINPNDDAHTALGRASTMADAGTTIVLFTGGADASFSQRSRRGAGVIIGCDSTQAAGWFKFDQSIEFSSVGPWSEQSVVSAKSVNSDV